MRFLIGLGTATLHNRGAHATTSAWGKLTGKTCHQRQAVESIPTCWVDQSCRRRHYGILFQSTRAVRPVARLARATSINHPFTPAGSHLHTTRLAVPRCDRPVMWLPQLPPPPPSGYCNLSHKIANVGRHEDCSWLHPVRSALSSCCVPSSLCRKTPQRRHLPRREGGLLDSLCECGSMSRASTNSGQSGRDALAI